MVIRVNISDLESKAKYADSLAKELKLKAEEINNIYYNLGGKVKSRNGIGQSILNHKTKIEAAYEKMYNISKFLFKAAENYRNAETQVEDKAKSLEAMFNFNNYNVMDSLSGLDIDAINASEISNIDNYNVGTEYSTGKSKSSGFLGGLFSAGLGIGVSIAKNLYYDPAAMAIAVSSNFLENLGVLSKGTAQSQYSKIKSLERNAEEALINKYVSNKASYYGAATITDFVSMGIGMAKAALGLKQIFAGMNGVGTGIVGAPLTGGSSFVISVASATAVAVGLVQTGYGTSVFFSSRNNFKNNYEKFKEAISEGKGNAGRMNMAGKTHPVSGVKFDNNGFPIFESKHDMYLDPSDYTKSRRTHFNRASKDLYNSIQKDSKLASQFTTEEINLFKAGKVPENYTWHHHQDTGRMQLVDSNLHSKTGHDGGFSIWGPGNK